MRIIARCHELLKIRGLLVFHLLQLMVAMKRWNTTTTLPDPIYGFTDRFMAHSLISTNSRNIILRFYYCCAISFSEGNSRNYSFLKIRLGWNAIRKLRETRLSQCRPRFRRSMKALQVQSNRQIAIAFLK